MILVGERASVQSPFGKLKCYLDHESKEFFIEINEATPLKLFTRSVLLNLLDLAEREGATKLYACLRRGTQNLGTCSSEIKLIPIFINSRAIREGLPVRWVHKAR